MKCTEFLERYDNLIYSIEFSDKGYLFCFTLSLLICFLIAHFVNRFKFVGLLLMLHKHLGFKMGQLKRTFSLVCQ